MSRPKRRTRPKPASGPVVTRPAARADTQLVDPNDPVIAAKNRRLLLLLVIALVVVCVYLLVQEVLPH